MSHADAQYTTLIHHIINCGDLHENRTGTDTIRVWGSMVRFDLQDGFPLLTQKKMHTKSVFVEMLGFVRGETDVRWYQDRGCKIWDADHARWHGKDVVKDEARYSELEKILRDCNGMEQEIFFALMEEKRLLADSLEHRKGNPQSLGYIYGHQWRSFGGYDQLAEIIKALKAGSNSRRLIMSAWAPHQFHLMSLPPCHVSYHFVKRGDFVDVLMEQRSCDTALGIPYNWANTALLTHLIAHAAGLKPGKMVWAGHDVHIYKPHLEGLQKQINQPSFDAPKLVLKTPVGTLPWDTNYEDIELQGYQHSDVVKFELFVG